MTDEPTTYIHPKYRLCSGAPNVVDGVTFRPYSTGILQYARISDDGQIYTARNYNASTYRAAVIGHGYIKGSGGKTKLFRTESAAMLAAVLLFKKLQAQRPEMRGLVSKDGHRGYTKKGGVDQK